MTGPFDPTMLLHISFLRRAEHNGRAFESGWYLMTAALQRGCIPLRTAWQGGISLQAVYTLLVDVVLISDEVFKLALMAADVHRRDSKHVVFVVPCKISHHGLNFRAV
jgi:hypothetical protein